ncbi:MAG: ComF family protein [Clostridium sp.]
MGKRVVKIIKYIINGILDVIFPPEEVCISCLEDGYVGLCPNCFNKIRKSKHNNGIFSYGYYVGPLKDLILAFKYKENYLAGTILGEVLCETIESNNLEFDIVAYVPLSKESMKKRGFNQSEILAKKVSEKYNVPISKALIKIKETKEQKTLSKEDRKNNIIDAFEVKKNNDINSKNVILIDDVTTTGVTAYECAKVLKQNGARTVDILTVAQSLI